MPIVYPILTLTRFKDGLVRKKNWGQAIMDGELTTCLLDNGAQLNFDTQAYAQRRGMAVHPMSRLSLETGQAIPCVGGPIWVRHDERQSALCERV